MREVCFVLCGDSVVHVDFGTPGHIADSSGRWEVIWEHREHITELVHTHPSGFNRFSYEDITTIQGVELALGRKLVWSLVTAKGYYYKRKENDVYKQLTRGFVEPWWVPFLRQLSFNHFGQECGNVEDCDSREETL